LKAAPVAKRKITVNNLFAKPSLTDWRVMLPVILVIVVIVWLGLHFHVNDKAVAGFALFFALVSGAFVWVVSLIGLVPIVGPLVVKVLAIPIVWLINGLGYVVSYIAIKRGYSQDVLTYRGLTITLIIGIVIGFVIGSLLS
jgi:hypothetical protein